MFEDVNDNDIWKLNDYAKRLDVGEVYNNKEVIKKFKNIDDLIEYLSIKDTLEDKKWDNDEDKMFYVLGRENVIYMEGIYFLIEE